MTPDVVRVEVERLLVPWLDGLSEARQANILDKVTAFALRQRADGIEYVYLSGPAKDTAYNLRILADQYEAGKI